MADHVRSARRPRKAGAQQDRHHQGEHDRRAQPAAFRAWRSGCTHYTHPKVVGATAYLLGKAGAKRIRFVESAWATAGPLEDVMLDSGWNVRALLVRRARRGVRKHQRARQEQEVRALQISRARRTCTRSTC